MKGHLLQDGVILHQLHALRRILTILGRNVTAGAREPTVLHLCALEYYLYAVALCFLACHGGLVSYYFNILPVNEALFNGLLQGGIETYFINQTKASSADLQLNPAVLLYIVELLAEQVYIEGALCAVLRV